MCGIPRSGSTLVWQILQSIFPRQKIIKNHPGSWEADGSMVISSIRNPYDITASLVRVRMSRERRKEINGKDVRQELTWMEKNFNSLKDILIGPHTPVLRYEEFYCNYDIIYNMIEKEFRIDIPENIREKLNYKYSLEANKNRALALKDFYDIDKDQIHGDHIGHVVPGYWKDYLPEWIIGKVMKVCEPIAKEWGYE